MIEALADYTVRTVTLGTGLLGLFCGILGTIAVLRRQSLVGDAMAHAALPGLCLAFLVVQSRESLPLMVGAALTALLAVLLVRLTTAYTRVAETSALGTALTVFFGLGVVLLSAVQRSPSANQAGLDKYLFGQAAGLIESQVTTIAAVGLLASATLLLCLKEFRLLAFDPVFARTTGFRTDRADLLFTGLLVLAVVVGLNTVGVVLLSAFLVAPGVAARQWTQRLRPMLIIAGLSGFLAGTLGALASIAWDAPTGPVVVLASVAWVVVSLAAGRLRRKSRPAQTNPQGAPA